MHCVTGTGLKLLFRHRLAIGCSLTLLLVLPCYFFDTPPVSFLARQNPIHIGAVKESKSAGEAVNTSECTSELVHVAIVCAGYNSSREAMTLIKSLLYHRSVLLHIHFIVDPPAKKILGTLFRTWNVPDLTVSFYSTALVERKVSWIPNIHYGGVYGLMKLCIPDILPPSIKRIIILDTDLLFLTDIAHLWNIFTLFRKGEVIGLVENQSDWYLGDIVSHRPWPAIGRGYNTGVVLYDMDELRKVDWSTLWHSVTEEELKHYDAVALADQDIINALLKINVGFLHVLPCVWNVQLSRYSRAAFCYDGDVSGIKLLHWNTPEGLRSGNIPDFLYQYFYSYTIFDSNLLRKPVDKCKRTARSKLDTVQTDFCHNMIDDASKLRKVHLYFMHFQDGPKTQLDVTLVMHLSTDRISMLEIIGERWAGPISVAIYVSDQDVVKVEKFVTNSPTLFHRRNIGYHLVFREQDDSTYPINMLRNIALQEAMANFVFLCDADFAPSSGLYQYLTEFVLPSRHRQNKTAYVIPAFEMLRYGGALPETKSDLLRQWASGSVVPFRSYIWPAGHNSTNYPKWKRSKRTYSVSWRKNFEPYVVLPKSLCPLYDRRFFGFGWNKVSHIMEIDAAGFTFSVVPFGFLVHLAHLPSSDLRRFRMSEAYRRCVSTLKSEFVNDLVGKYQIDAGRYL